MPLFDLQCKNCNEEFTKLVSFEALSEVKCPKCKSKTHERVYKAKVKGPISGDSNKLQASSGFS